MPEQPQIREPDTPPVVVQKKTPAAEKDLPRKTEKPPARKPYLSASEITKSGKRVSRQNQRQSPSTNTDSVGQNRTQGQQNPGRSGRYGTKDPGLQGILDQQKRDEYYAQLKNFITPKWKQPSALQLNGEKPSAIIRLVIDGNGRIQTCVVKQRSGNTAMDESMAALVEVLKRSVVPVPPGGKTVEVEVVMEIK